MNSKIERISTVGMSREDWLAERKKSLGGSDMGAVLGLVTVIAPLGLWLGFLLLAAILRAITERF